MNNNISTLHNINLFAATPAFTLDELKAYRIEKAERKILKKAIERDCGYAHRSDINKQMHIPLLYILEHCGRKVAVDCMRINWFEYKQLYMQFVNGCAARAEKYAAAATAYADAHAADAAAAAAAAASVAAAYAAAAAAAAAAYAAAAAAAAVAYAAAYADSADSADSAAAYAAAYAAERERQQQHLMELLTETKTKQRERKLP